jgi:uncharacterized protein (TIGR02147 family)
LKLVIDGERNLTPSMAERFADACRLKGKASEFFVVLVRFCQAKTLNERALIYQELQRFRRYRNAHQLDAAQDTYHATWYLPAIRELVATRGFREDPTWIAERLLPKIRPEQAEQAIDTLLQLGLLSRSKKGALRQTEPVISTGADRVRSLHLRSYHATMLQQAITSMDRLPATRRDISSLTLKLGPDGIQKLKKRIQEIRREFIDLAESENPATQVVHVGFQLFPLSEQEPE